LSTSRSAEPAQRGAKTASRRNVRARAVSGNGEPFKSITIERRPIGPQDVLIDIAYAGICHTDVSHARSEWEPTIFPLVPGHEIAGTVAHVGGDVTRVAMGDRVGVGVMVDSCRHCPDCQAGEEQHCSEKFVRTYNAIGRDGQPTYGGFSEAIVVDQAFVAKIPDAISLEQAAPLLCAGITVYSPLQRWSVGPGSRVAILGLGGLGHLGIQVSKALGAHTTVVDLAAEKRADALALGADAFIVPSGASALADLSNSLDLVLSTIPGRFDLDVYLSLLKSHGVLVNLGVSDQPLTFDPFSLLARSRIIAGSSIGGMAQTQEMLEFCGRYGIGASVEVIGAGEMDAAFARLDTGDVRYRFVMDARTLVDC
jgi:uncharacterized zinc-type alcohol dehydrogenase-like protein